MLFWGRFKVITVIKLSPPDIRNVQFSDGGRGRALLGQRGSSGQGMRAIYRYISGVLDLPVVPKSAVVRYGRRNRNGMVGHCANFLRDKAPHFPALAQREHCGR